MKKILVPLIVAAALLLAASAQAASVDVSPEAQQKLDASGAWVVGEDAPAAVPASMASAEGCTYSKARNVGVRLEDWQGVAVFLRQKFSVCAHNGKLWNPQMIVSHGSPGRFWQSVGSTIRYRFGLQSTRKKGGHVEKQWKFVGRSVTQYYVGTVVVAAHINGDHGIYFTSHRSLQ